MSAIRLAAPAASRRDGGGADDLVRQVRDALRHLHDPVALQTHPLAALVEPKSGDRAGSAGRALRGRLLDALAALQPEAAADARARRRARLLSLRYVDGQEIGDVCRQLAISQREYSREHRQALEALASLLAARSEAAGRTALVGAGDTPAIDPLLAGARQPEAGPEPGGRMPTPLSSFIGRERERAEAARLLSSVRLVTLTGPPGVGKTRLALQVAAECRGAYADGVVFVPLAPVRDPAPVASAIARALGLPEAPSRPLLWGALRQHLAEQHLLLVLDNFEQVLDAAPALATLLAACPRLAALVTSRAALRLSGEHELAVPPLALPERGRALGAAELAGYAAVRLFLERARALGEPYAPAAEHAPAVAEICRRLDGLPLAIELAAARSRLLSPPAMLARLERRLPLLTGGARDLPARQRTLREAIAWSYHLLGPEEQRLFRRLAMFAGGFDLEGAEAVAGEGGGNTAAGLESLLARSLVQRDAGVEGERRFVLLQTLREFGEEQLCAAGEEAALARRHAEYYLALAEQGGGQGPDPTTWLDRLQQEHDNLRDALGRLVEWGEGETGLRLATALAPFWERRRFVGEGRQWLDLLLGLPAAAAASAARADALRWAARFAAWQGEYAAARGQAEECLALCRRLGYGAGTARALECLGGVALELVDYGPARAHFEEALALHRASGDRGGARRVLLSLGNLACAERDFPRASACLEACLALARELAEAPGVAAALTYLGHVACGQGDYARARALYERNLALQRRLRADRYVTWPLWGLGNVALGEGDPAAAAARYREALARAREQGNRLEQAVFLLACGQAAAAGGDYVGALRTIAAADALRAALASPWPPGEREERERALGAARAALPPEACAAAWAEGRAAGPEQAVADALEEQARAANERT